MSMTDVGNGVARARTMRRRVTLGIVWCGIAVGALPASAQRTQQATSPQTKLQAESQPPPPDPAQALPIPRFLTDVPNVSIVGNIPMVDGHTTTLPITPKLAIGDLGYYSGTLESQHPLSVAAYPADSLRDVNMRRAAQWVARLRGMPSDDPDGTQLLMFAEAAMRAGQDSAARRMIDAQLAATRGPLQQSFLLAGAVSLFTDAVDDTVRLAARVAVAAAYAQTLSHLRATGFSTKRDSINMVFRQVVGVVQLVSASVDLGRVGAALQYTDQALVSAARLDADLRGAPFRGYYPMDALAILIVEQRGHAALDTLSQLRNVLAIAPGLRDGVERADLLGQPAPAMPAHVWLNTPDSLYVSTPRAHDMNDHAVHLIVFGYFGNIAIAERLHQRFPTVHVLDMNAVTGAIGSDIVPAPEEIDWIRTFLRDRRHATMPIGIWVGSKQPNKYGGAVPAPAPGPALYHASRSVCVIVDRRGIIHDILPIQGRADESKIAAILATLTADDAPPGGPPR